MVVYGAFSGAVVAGLWDVVSWQTLLILTVACSVFLTVIMLLAFYLPKWLGFNREDQIAMFFCGFQKKLWQVVCTDGTNLIYRTAFRDDCFADYDFPPNSINGVCGVIANYWSKHPIDEFKTVDELKRIIRYLILFAV